MKDVKFHWKCTYPNFRLAAADGPGFDGAGLVVAGQDLGHAAVRDEQLSGDVAWAYAHRGHLDDSAPDVLGQRPPVHEHPTQLVDARLTCGQIIVGTSDSSIREKDVNSSEARMHLRM